MKEVVKYNNDFNKVGLRAFTANQLDLLMGICSKFKEKQEDTITFDFDYLKKLIKLDKNYTTDEFIEELVNVNKKLLALNFTFEDEKVIEQFALFTNFTIYKESLTLKANINKRFSYLLNDLKTNFTRFELEEYVNFKSTYTKEFFRRMKQFSSSGVWEVSIEVFRRLLDIPEKYRMCDINTYVLKPINKELKGKFNLKITKLYKKKYGSGVGRAKVSGFRFNFLKNFEVKILEEHNENNSSSIEFNVNNYLYRTVKFRDIFTGEPNFLKIQEIGIEKDGKIKVQFKNQDTDYVNTYIYDDLNVWDLTFNKYVV